MEKNGRLDTNSEEEQTFIQKDFFVNTVPDLNANQLGTSITLSTITHHR